MSYMISTTASVIATLTRIGRQMLASNGTPFKISKWAASDDEILYPLIDLDHIRNTEEDAPSILALPITEPSTNESNEMVFKIFVNQDFLSQTFPDQQTNPEYITALISTGGLKIILHSDDAGTKVKVSFNSVNPQGRSYIAPYYQLQFDTSNDFYTFNFLNPANNTFMSDNWETIAPGTYNFIKASKSGNNPYSGTPTGAPSIVLEVQFQETTQYHEKRLLPANRDTIEVPKFLTITQLDVNKQPNTALQPIVVPLQVVNIVV